MPLSLPRSLVSAAQSAVAFLSPEYATGDTAITRASVATYVDSNGIVQTAQANVLRDAHYVSGSRTILTEQTRTNIVLWNRDLTNVVWVKTNATVAKDQAGADGVANAASSITATAGNATVLQSITAAVNTRITSARVKRLVGVGAIEMTQDNGVTWTPVTVTAGYTRVFIPSASVTNPVVGFRIVTSGDSIAVDYVQNELGTVVSSDMETTTVAFQRQGDLAYLADARLNPIRTVTVYVRQRHVGAFVNDGATKRILHIGSSTLATDPRLGIQMASAGLFQQTFYDDGVTPVTAGGATPSPSPALGATVESRAVLTGSFTMLNGISVNRGAEVVGTESAASASAPTWAFARANLTGGLSADNTMCAYERILIVEGVRTMADMRQMAGG